MKRIVISFLMTVLSGCLFGCLSAAGFIGVGVNHYLYNVRIAQYVRLADDASLPGQKVDFLKQYRGAIDGGINRDDARYIWKQRRLTKTAQLTNLDGLIKRLSDLTTMEPGSMAYQQGMQQVSGQEFEHTIKEINGIFKACYMRDHFWNRFTLPWTALLSLTLAVSVIFVAFVIHNGIRYH